MSSLALVALLAPVLPAQLDPQPQPEDVVAGWGAFTLFILLFVAVGLLGWSLTRHLRKVDQSAAEGRYDPSKPRRPRS